MPLHELREARGLSQKMLAEVLHVQQASIAKMEERTELYLSTLRINSKPWLAGWRWSRASRMVR